MRLALSRGWRFLAARERLLVALVSIVATRLFFFEYFRPFKRVHFPFDIEGFHYPLLDYAFRSLRDGRFPLWDPSIYCGVPFAANIQASLFYPPVWLLFALNIWRTHLPYGAVETLAAAHVWLAFFLAWLWLRGRFALLPSVLGAAVYGYSGYMLSQIQHLGVIMGYAWVPLALWGIDQTEARRSWRPLWKVAAASALCLLAGFPSTWVVLCCSVMVYAVCSLRLPTILGTAGALGFSLLLVAVQLLPTMQANPLKTFDPKYGNGIQSPEFYAALFIPNYFGLRQNPQGWGDPRGQYLYLGAPALFGILYLFRARKLRPYLPVVGLAIVGVVMLGNPFNLTTELLERSRLAIQVVRAWNFLEQIPLAAALLAAIGLEEFLRRPPRRKLSRRTLVIALALLVVWCVRQCYVWVWGHPDFAKRWPGIFESAITLALFTFLLAAWRAAEGRRQTWVLVPLLFLVWLDYKVYGTRRGFNAVHGSTEALYSGEGFAGLDPSLYHAIRSSRGYRIALDENGAPFSTDLRHWGLTTPQGFDPFITVQYKTLIEQYTRFQTDRLFFLDPADTRLLDLLAVRYFVTRPSGLHYDAIRTSPLFRRISGPDSFYEVYEYVNAKPSYRWSTPSGAGPRPAPASQSGWAGSLQGSRGSIRILAWAPEKRRFGVHADLADRLVLIEQHFPGWKATIDGRDVPVETWDKAFQSVAVPPGDHIVEFDYRPASIRFGALISVAALLGSVFTLRPVKFRFGGAGGSACHP